jgi:hypothetical protein
MAIYKNTKSYKYLIQIYLLIRWTITCRIGPPPWIYKAHMLKHYQHLYKLRTFIETGTYLGDTTYSMRNKCECLHTIELNKTLYENAVKRLSLFKNIIVHYGDSGIVLPKLISEIHEPILFWLDGHYCGNSTSKGDKCTPIMNELDAIFRHRCKSHVMLIDDARDFNGKNDYPEIKYLIYQIKVKYKSHNIMVKNDIIRITPK